MTENSRIKMEMAALMPRLWRFALGLTGSKDTAEDLVQTTYERALANIDKWQEGTRLDSWMFRIAQNVFFNDLRSARVRDRYLRLIGDDESRHGNDGRRDTEARLMLESVRTIVKRLPEDQRSILLLVCVEGFSYGEAAEILDIPEGTVTSRLSRARAVLRQSLAEPTDASVGFPETVRA